VARTFVVGTRGSRLALRQTDLVVQVLRAAHPGVAIDLREVHTEGDRTSAPLSQIGGTGVFTKAIEEALLRGDVDIAVHSMKDLPPAVAHGLAIAAVPERADPRDVLVTRDGATLEELPAGARIGTGSTRRAVQLRALRPDIATAEIRGNVDTRIRKVDAGEYDGVVLALAGLQRLGLEARAAHTFEADVMTPAVGQAAVAVETRADDAETVALVGAVDHWQTRVAVSAERAFLERLGAGCRLPVGCWARARHDGAVALDAFLADDDGRAHRLHRPFTGPRVEREGPLAHVLPHGRLDDPAEVVAAVLAARQLGTEAAEALLAQAEAAR
jgi:hydroxymethylbilane synthase